MCLIILSSLSSIIYYLIHNLETSLCCSILKDLWTPFKFNLSIFYPKIVSICLSLLLFKSRFYPFNFRIHIVKLPLRLVFHLAIVNKKKYIILIFIINKVLYLLEGHISFEIDVKYYFKYFGLNFLYKLEDMSIFFNRRCKLSWWLI